MLVVVSSNLTIKFVKFVIQIAGHLYNDSNDGNVNFTVNNTRIVVSSADYGPIIIEVISKSNGLFLKENQHLWLFSKSYALKTKLLLFSKCYVSTSLYLASSPKKDYKFLAIGLGVGTFLLIFLAVIIIVVVSVYWRK